MQDVVEPVVPVSALERENVKRLFDDTDDRSVSARIATDLARILCGDVEAGRTKDNLVAHPADRVSELIGKLNGLAQQVESEPLGCLWTNSG
jgi:hypothetical protein